MMTKRPFPLITLLALTLLGTAVLAACASPPRPSSSPTAPDGWWSDAIFYGVYVRGFYDSGFDGYGDLQGLIQKLDYLNDGDPTTTDDLGVSALWLLPIMPAFSLDGYDVLDYWAVEPDYGTLTDLRQLVDAAHQRGMRIIIDLALNHTSARHPWFEAARADPNSPWRDWYVWISGNPTAFGPDNQPVWHQVDGYHYYGLFGADKPDLNYRNPAVTAEMQSIARFWLAEVGVDGLRLDAVQYLIADEVQQNNTQATLDWLADFNATVKATTPQALLVGDAEGESDTVARYVDQGAVDLGFEFRLAGSILFSVDNNDPSALRSRLNETLFRLPNGRFATFLSNQKQDRALHAVTQFEDAPVKAHLAATALLTLPGVPFLLYGEELGLSGRLRDQNVLAPLPWSGGLYGGFSVNAPWQPFSDDPATVNVAAQSADPFSLLNHYRRLIHLRSAHAALRRGGLETLESNCDKALAYLRSMPATAAAPADNLIVLLNFARTPQAGCRFALPQSDLAPGVYAAHEALSGAPAATLTVGENGRFADYTPLATADGRGQFGQGTLAAHGSYVLILEERDE